MKILLTNDDGIDAEGINALANILSARNIVSIVAPVGQKSATSHALTINKHIEYYKHKTNNLVKDKYSVVGTPADCIKLAVLSLFKDELPDLIISGINNGANLGCDILYSGTIAAAMEGRYMGIKSIAVSMYSSHGDLLDFDTVAKYIDQNLEKLLDLHIDNNSILSINHPNGKACGTVITKASLNHYTDYYKVVDESDVNKVQIFGEPQLHSEQDCDINWAEKRYITISPLTVDKNDYQSLSNIKGIKI